MSDGDRLCSPKRDTLGDATPRDELWFGSHLLATDAFMAATWRLEKASACDPQDAGLGTPHRSAESHCRQPVHTGHFWGALTGKNPTDRAKKGSKRHLLIEGHGVPLAVRISGAQRHDSKEFLGLLKDIPRLPDRQGRWRKRPGSVYGDRAYGTPKNKQTLKQRHIVDHLAAPRMPHGSGLGKIRWRVEQVLSWISQARRLRLRYDRKVAMFRAFHYLQLARICLRVLLTYF